jgi:hypothetical protein
MVQFLLQVLNTVIDNLYLLLDNWHSVGKVVVLRYPVFKLLQAVIRHFATHQNAAYGTDYRTQKRN